MDERSHRTERRTKSPHPNSLANLRLVQPGQPSLNPGERPKVPAEVREAAMALTPDAIRVLGEIMNDPKAPPATRVTAADKILDRALGRPAQSVEVKGEKRTFLSTALLTWSRLPASAAWKVARLRVRRIQRPPRTNQKLNEYKEYPVGRFACLQPQPQTRVW